MERSRILIIEDDKDIREAVTMLLKSEGYDVISAPSGEEGLDLLTDETDLVILDVMLPGISGFEVCTEIRKRSFAPVLFLTAKTQERDKLIGLTSGGDDYLTKPFSYSELIGRVKAHLRRYRMYKNKREVEKDHINVLKCSDMTLIDDFGEVYKGETPIYLSDKEYGILKLLMENRGRIFSAERIYENVWNEPFFYNSSNTVMVHIRNLRLKIEDDPNKPKLIITVWGRGYKFASSEE